MPFKSFGAVDSCRYHVTVSIRQRDHHHWNIAASDYPTRGSAHDGVLYRTAATALTDDHQVVVAVVCFLQYLFEVLQEAEQVEADLMEN